MGASPPEIYSRENPTQSIRDWKPNPYGAPDGIRTGGGGGPVVYKRQGKNFTNNLTTQNEFAN